MDLCVSQAFDVFIFLFIFTAFSASTFFIGGVGGGDIPLFLNFCMALTMWICPNACWKKDKINVVFFLNQVCCYWVIELAWMCESGNEDIQHILPFILIKVTFSYFCLLFYFEDTRIALINGCKHNLDE
jgi:hypothetical protein